MSEHDLSLRPIGFVRSTLQSLADAPRQGDEGAPEAWIELDPSVLPACEGLAVGQEIVVLTWLDRARRDVLRVHPRDDTSPLSEWFFSEYLPRREEPTFAPSAGPVGTRPAQDVRNQLF